MNQSEVGSSAIEAPKTQSGPTPRSRWLALAHAAWVVTALLALGVLVASLTGYSVWLRGENPVAVGPEPISGFYVLSGVMSLATALVCLSLGIILFRQKRDEPMALFVSFYVMTYGIVFAGPLENLSPLFPGVADLAVGVIQPLFLTVPTVCLIILLPDGRPIPPWTRWLIPLSIVSMALLPLIDASSMATLDTLPSQIWGAILLVLFGLAIAARIYRYRRVSSPVEREQMRWVIFGLVVWFILLILQSFPYFYLENLPPRTTPPAWAAASALLWWLSLSAIPVTLTIAILKYRLYEIDVIINRALVYGALTAILAGLYSASISLLQKVFIALTGEKSDAAVVITTLVLASGFTPIRTRLQAVVDRRFRDVHDPWPRLSEFSKRIDEGIWVVDVPVAMARLLEAAVAAFGAVGGEIVWRVGSEEETVVTHGRWTGKGQLTATVSADGVPLGKISLGDRRDGSPYAPRDAKALSNAAESLSRALSVRAAFPKT